MRHDYTVHEAPNRGKMLNLLLHEFFITFRALLAYRGH